MSGRLFLWTLLLVVTEAFQPILHRSLPNTRLFATPPTYDDTCDILVLGSGPAARAIASLLAVSDDLDVLLTDTNIDKEFVPNYGVWQDEWQAVVDRYAAAGVSLDGKEVPSSVNRLWKTTDCYFGGSFDIPVTERLRIDRPYCRIDRMALREALSPDSGNGNAPYRMMAAKHISEAFQINLYQPAGTLIHDADGTTIQLETLEQERLTVRTKLVIDCTGHETKLVLREPRGGNQAPPGFQIAYGALVQVDETESPDLTQIGPYDKEAMTLFDYRTDHYVDPEDEAKVGAAPTFMYAMPLYDNLIFFEETSLVARPAVSFQECKDRCIERLKYHRIKVTEVYEEEFCYIPMGGALPAKDQRIIGLGGSAVMVHPSTGYHLCRVLMAAADVAEVIRNELVETAQPNLDRAAAAAYHAMWSPENMRQRNFAVFGGEFLMKQDVVGLRGFFDGFFRLPLPLWAGFLAGWPGLPNNDKHESWWARLWYGLNFIVRIPGPVAADMVYSILTYSIFRNLSLMQSVTPFLGAPESYEYKKNMDTVGDVAAKQEGRRMVQASQITMDLPRFFDDDTGTKAETETAFFLKDDVPFVGTVFPEKKEIVSVASPESTIQESTVQKESISSQTPPEDKNDDIIIARQKVKAQEALLKARLELSKSTRTAETSSQHDVVHEPVNSSEPMDAATRQERARRAMMEARLKRN
ncbi:lycopene beta-cyclase [Fistulifera solaris]|jgi:lycopene beta-cyclase|uniref:lycopene beta-cyclase n=1 Tax=Fistulifera solaris TaxID=1519565 RepID=A0A1Z5K641_FISSO|nr:lycopene beta-cyclase [Fistulifera solaris]|eukprot:GAX21707.1 lycopene beta-cyclase [Fistulifera solaris]